MALLVYVDDLVLMGPSENILTSFVDVLKLKFKMKDLGEVSHILGMKVTRSRYGIFLSQSQYFRKLMTEFQLENCNEKETPMVDNLVVDTGLDEDIRHDNVENLYRKMIGSLMHT